MVDGLSARRLRALLNKKNLEFQKKIAAIARIPCTSEDLKVGDDLKFFWSTPLPKWYQGTLVKAELGEYTCTDGFSKHTDGNLLRLKVRGHHVRPSSEAIKEMIETCRGDELPIFPSYSVFVAQVQSHLLKWKQPMYDLFDQYKSLTISVLNAIIESSTENVRLRNFFKTTIVANLMGEELDASVRRALDEEFQAEQRPYTLNHYLYENLHKLRQAPLLENFKASAGGSTQNVFSLSTVLSILSTHGMGNDSKMSNEDHEAREIQFLLLLRISRWLRRDSRIRSPLS